MSRYRIELATPACDAELRRVAAIPMPGRVSLSFQREPSYLDANCVLGPQRQTIVGWDEQAGEAIGLGTRSVRDVYVQGEVMRVGYLSALRIVPRARNLGLLARAYRYLQELHERDPEPPPFYLTTIAEGNAAALKVLTSGRAGLPKYRQIGTLSTLVIPRRKCRARGDVLEVESASPDEIDEVLAFLQREGRARQFFPLYSQRDFLAGDAAFRSLQPSDVRIVRRAGQIVAVAGLWDQRAFRQTIVESYDKWLNFGRPLYNQWAKFTTGWSLPAPGEALRQRFAAFPIVANFDERAFRELLAALTTGAGEDGSFLTIGLCDNDPLLPLARRLSVAAYRTRIYAVSWNELPLSVSQLAQRPYYLELGCL